MNKKILSCYIKDNIIKLILDKTGIIIHKKDKELNELSENIIKKITKLNNEKELKL